MNVKLIELKYYKKNFNEGVSKIKNNFISNKYYIFLKIKKCYFY